MQYAAFAAASGEEGGVTVFRLDHMEKSWRPQFHLGFNYRMWFVGIFWSKSTKLHPGDFDAYRLWVYPLPMVQLFFRWRLK